MARRRKRTSLSGLGTIEDIGLLEGRVSVCVESGDGKMTCYPRQYGPGVPRGKGVYRSGKKKGQEMKRTSYAIKRKRSSGPATAAQATARNKMKAAADACCVTAAGKRARPKSQGGKGCGDNYRACVTEFLRR